MCVLASSHTCVWHAMHARHAMHDRQTAQPRRHFAPSRQIQTPPDTHEINTEPTRQAQPQGQGALLRQQTQALPHEIVRKHPCRPSLSQLYTECQVPYSSRVRLHQHVTATKGPSDRWHTVAYKAILQPSRSLLGTVTHILGYNPVNQAQSI